MKAHEFDKARQQMVDRQLITRGITDERVLDAMRHVPREHFLPCHSAALAYSDGAQRIGGGQTISQPYIVALMSQTLRVLPGDKVLEIGTGSGYQTAVLAEMGAQVYSLEIIPQLAMQAQKVLAELGYAGVVVMAGDGAAGLAKHAPYQGIIVTCSPQDVPPALIEQLDEGGRLAVPLDEGYPQMLVLFTKKGEELHRQNITGVVFVPMTGGDTGKPTPGF